jgi:2-phospho-L-lactate/phosphoenolpyruvate guanylyltransferase
VTKLVAALPVKTLELSKSRLGDAIADRAALSLRMLRDVLSGLQSAELFADIAVVSEDPRALAYAREQGVTALKQQSQGLNEACAEAAAWARGLHATGLLIAHADLPQLTALEVRQLVAQLDGVPTPAAVLAPDRSDRGTNLLLACPPDALPWCFGPDSFRRHAEAAAEAGVLWRVFRSTGTGHDVDTAADLAAWGPKET